MHHWGSGRSCLQRSHRILAPWFLGCVRPLGQTQRQSPLGLRSDEVAEQELQEGTEAVEVVRLRQYDMSNPFCWMSLSIALGELEVELFLIICVCLSRISQGLEIPNLSKFVPSCQSAKFFSTGDGRSAFFMVVFAFGYRSIADKEPARVKSD